MKDQYEDVGRHQDDLEGAELVKALLALRGQPANDAFVDETCELTVGG
jgi:hypothetical protein